MLKIVIADTSCLIVLDKTQHIVLLQHIFDEVAVTPEVSTEFGDNLPEWIKIKEVKDTKRQQILEISLDRGEASAIALALESENPLLLIDEKKGRRIAKELGLSIMGTLGIFIKAKELGLISSLMPAFEKLKNAGFRVSDSLVQQILSVHESR